jgi:hypothetical protein
MKTNGIALVIATSMVCTVGCTGTDSTTEPSDEEMLAELEGQDAKSDAVSWIVKSAGDLALGYDKPVAYTKNPRYRSVKFTAQKGDQLEIFVQGGGDATAWLFDSHFLPISHNDDFSEDTTDANVEVGSLLWGGDYYVVFRDKKLASSTLNVAVAKVNLPANAPSTESVVDAYEALLDNGTLNSKRLANANGLPFLPKGLFNRWDAERAQVQGLEVDVFGFDVGGQTVYVVRKFLPGVGMEAGLYVSVGAMIAIVGGSSEHIESWEG